MTQPVDMLFATSNLNKIKEAKKLLGSNYRVTGLKENGIETDIPELSYSFEGNAMEKAFYISATFNKNCFSEDSGLVIDALNGEPGIYAARYGGPNATAAGNNALVLSKMKGLHNRSARFVAAICLFIHNEFKFFTGSVEGTIATETRGERGFGYDPIFIPAGFDMTFGEMEPEAKNDLSHRKKAIEQLAAFLSK